MRRAAYLVPVTSTNASPALPTDHLKGNPQVPAACSGQAGRENITIQHPCRFAAQSRSDGTVR
jgi:hypothetical protein